jgi:hypothetical protein
MGEASEQTAKLDYFAAGAFDAKDAGRDHFIPRARKRRERWLTRLTRP